MMQLSSSCKMCQSRRWKERLYWLRMKSIFSIDITGSTFVIETVCTLIAEVTLYNGEKADIHFT